MLNIEILSLGKLSTSIQDTGMSIYRLSIGIGVYFWHHWLHEMSEVVIADIDAKNMVHLFTEDNEHF